MKNYELMTPDEIEALSKVRTIVQFDFGCNMSCFDLFSKDFSFNKIIPVPDNYQIVHGPVIEKALATVLTNYGRNNPQTLPGYYPTIIEMLQYSGIDVPENFIDWFRKCTEYCDAETFQRFHALGQRYCENYKLTKTFTSAGFCSKFWGTPSDVIECSVEKDEIVTCTLITLDKPPLPWLIVFSEMYPSVIFTVTVEENITYKLNCGSLEKIQEETISDSFESKTIEILENDKHSLDTMGIFD